MNVEIKVIKFPDIITAMQLIEECFDTFVAPDYSEKGIATFNNNFIHNQKFIDKFSNGIEKMYGAYCNGIDAIFYKVILSIFSANEMYEFNC